MRPPGKWAFSFILSVVIRMGHCSYFLLSCRPRLVASGPGAKQLIDAPVPPSNVTSAFHSDATPSFSKRPLGSINFNAHQVDELIHFYLTEERRDVAAAGAERLPTDKRRDEFRGRGSLPPARRSVMSSFRTSGPARKEQKNVTKRNRRNSISPCKKNPPPKKKFRAQCVVIQRRN